MERIHKENWEDYSPNNNILGVEMENGNKYYLLPNVYGFVPVNLKIHVSTGYSDTDDLESGISQCSVLDGNKKVFEFNTMSEMISWATL